MNETKYIHFYYILFHITDASKMGQNGFWPKISQNSELWKNQRKKLLELILKFSKKISIEQCNVKYDKFDNLTFELIEAYSNSPEGATT